MVPITQLILSNRRGTEEAEGMRGMRESGRRADRKFPCVPVSPCPRVLFSGEKSETDDCVRDDINESVLMLVRVQG